MSDTSWGPLLHWGAQRPRNFINIKMHIIYIFIVIFMSETLMINVAAEDGKDYKMSIICKNHFLRDLYRKIYGAVLISQNERNLDCAITFQTHSILQRFMLRFDQLQLDCNDHLYIYDGAHAVSNFKADLSCRNTHLTVGSIYTRTNFVTLKYVTDGWGTDANGFRLVITAVKDPKHTCKDFRCTLKEFCIDDDLVCDGVNHCGDGSDELASPLCSNTEASTILGMQKTWFAVAAVILVLSTIGLVASSVICYCRKRVVTPRHLQNTNNNTHPHQPVSFPLNGGINQPGCWEKRNPFGCNHHRSAAYFAESINSKIGFWGWPCSGLFAYLLGLCPPRFPAVLAGDPVDHNYKGFYLVKTKSEIPFASGLFTVNSDDEKM